ncbi:MAG: phosphoglycerate dehydrogenase [Planctomycetota bacterium]|nr:phosphoglycerate dehydrogenase [Planctomycetota bacterium]MDA1178012.1 phosphoglycerate dehydrogenase [Planctomycetota bacterium]
MSWTVFSTALAFSVNGLAPQADLHRRGCRLVTMPTAGPLSEQEMIQILPEADAVIAANDAFTPNFFAACPRLKLVARYGVGIDTVDLKAATAAGVVVTNTPGAMTDAVADYCFALLLCIVRRVAEGQTRLRAGEWPELPGLELPGKTLGLIGFGSIGQAVARRAVGFDLRILAHDRQVAAADRAGSFPHVEFVDLDVLFQQSDFISVHAPNMPETRHLVNEHRLRQMRSTAYLINTSRGGLIDEAALMTVLHEGGIAGAAIDVYQQEPLPLTHPLRQTPRLLLTPHSAFNSKEAVQEMSRLCVASVLALMSGERPASMCNPEVLDRPNFRARL